MACRVALSEGCLCKALVLSRRQCVQRCSAFYLVNKAEIRSFVADLDVATPHQERSPGRAQLHWGWTWGHPGPCRCRLDFGHGRYCALRPQQRSFLLRSVATYGGSD